MGVAKHLLNDYELLEEKCKDFNTPIGNLSVKIDKTNLNFKLFKKYYKVEKDEKKHLEVFRIEIETDGLKMNDIINIKFDNERNFEYYAADENTIMITETNNNLLMAIIAYDPEFSYNDMKYLNGDYYSYAIKNICNNGIEYEIIDDGKEYVK